MSSCGEPYALVWILSKILASEADSNGVPRCKVLKDYAEREINAFLWMSLITITVLLLRKLSKFFNLWATARLIPGPPCPSFYGHSKLISRGNLTDILSKSHGKYGPVVKMWLGPTQLLVSIKDPELIKEMLLKAKDKLPLTGRAFRLAFGQSSLFSSSFDKVQEGRNSLATELHGILLQNANMVPKKVLDYMLESIQDNAVKGSVDCNVLSQRLAFTILGTTLFGDSFLAWTKATVYEELLMMIAKDACFWASYNVTPFWKRGFWRYQCLCTKLKVLTQDIIHQCRKNCNNSCQVDKKPHETTDFKQKAAPCSQYCSSDTMSDNLFSRKLGIHHDAKEEPCGDISSVMFHGCLTTAGLIGNMFGRLVTHPDIQDKIYSEISMTGKDKLKPQQHDVEKMPFLLATVYESARLLPAGPLLQRCSLKQDLNLKSGITIPAGAVLVVPVQLVQMDHSSWGNDASQFNPYRFLSRAEKRCDLADTKSFTVSGREPADARSGSYVLNEPNENATFLPFGSGTRVCVGKKFAILGVATLFASLLEHYEIRLEPGSEGNPEPMMNSCVLQPLPSPRIVFAKRYSCMNKET